jgi:hypothetical protein
VGGGSGENRKNTSCQSEQVISHIDTVDYRGKIAIVYKVQKFMIYESQVYSANEREKIFRTNRILQRQGA